jgi:hypothetical protein
MHATCSTRKMQLTDHCTHALTAVLPLLAIMFKSCPICFAVQFLHVSHLHALAKDAVFSLCRRASAAIYILLFRLLLLLSP